RWGGRVNASYYCQSISNVFRDLKVHPGKFSDPHINLVNHSFQIFSIHGGLVMAKKWVRSSECPPPLGD
ncbi:MAG: hypothetical protein N2C14_13540, partial [Planctomycetales bacterium]